MQVEIASVRNLVATFAGFIHVEQDKVSEVKVKLGMFQSFKKLFVFPLLTSLPVIGHRGWRVYLEILICRSKIAIWKSAGS